MKKILAVILSIGILLSLGACGNGNNNEQTDSKVQTESKAENKVENKDESKAENEDESKNEIKKITKEEYEKMTEDDLFNAVVKSPDSVTLDEYIAIAETLQYVDITDSLDIKRNITDSLLKKISSEYDSKHRPNPRDWVPVLITHEAPQVRGEAFGNAYYLYGESPEFMAAAKEVMKTETEPYVIYNIIRQIPTSFIASDPEIAAFVQANTTNEHTLVQKIATSMLEKAAQKNQ